MIHNNVKLIELVKRHDYKKDLYNDLEQETKHSSLPSFYFFIFLGVYNGHSPDNKELSKIQSV